MFTALFARISRKKLTELVKLKEVLTSKQLSMPIASCKRCSYYSFSHNAPY